MKIVFLYVPKGIFKLIRTIFDTEHAEIAFVHINYLSRITKFIN